MPNSHLKRLWDGVQNLVNLRKINLRESKQLIELPDLFTAQNLEVVDLFGCRSLCHFHPYILSLPRLSQVELSHCQNLKSLKAESQSKSITRLSVICCSSLREFSFSSDKITDLRLHGDGMHVEVLDFSIGPMKKLQWFALNGLALKNLPINDICCMRSLHKLYLYDCGGIIDESKLHTLFDALLSLKVIDLDGACKLTELPNNIKHLSRLEELCLRNCKSLQSLPEFPPSIEELYVLNCTSLKMLQLTSHIESSLLADEIMLGSMLCSSVSYLKNLGSLGLVGCEQLYELPESIGSLSLLYKLNLSGSNVESLPASIKHLSNLYYMFLRNCRRLRFLPKLPLITYVHANGCISLENHSLSRVVEYAYFSLKRYVYKKQAGYVCYPGRNAPKWFSFNQVTKASNYITLELPSTTNNLIGFIFCSVLSHHSYDNYDLVCKLHYDGKEKGIISRYDLRWITFDSHNVFLWCDPYSFKNSRFNLTIDGQNTNYRPKVSFEFSIANGNKIVDGVIEACGVCPIYASEYLNFIQQMELESNVDIQKKACRDAKENSFHGILKYASFSLKQGKCGNFEESIIPKWFTYKSSTKKHGCSEVSVQLAPNFDSLIGFIFCFVIPHFSSEKRDQCHSSCGYSLYDGRNIYWEGPIGWHYSMKKFNSNNVFMWYDPLYCECILKELQERAKDNEVLEFQFKFGDGLIKECGVRPLYVLEYINFLQQNKLEVSTRTKRHQSIDEDQHQLPTAKKLKESSIVQSIPMNSESKTSYDVDELLLVLSQLNLESTENCSHQK